MKVKFLYGVASGLLLVTLISAVYQIFSEALKYGPIYQRQITIGSEIYVETVNLYISSLAVFIILGLLLLIVKAFFMVHKLEEHSPLPNEK